MRFAKYWQSVEVPINSQLYGKPSQAIWGFSDISNEEAQNHANIKAERFKRIAGGELDLLDHEYEYWNSPIKEEIIDQITTDDGRVIGIISRNAYGALVLNTETALFGDIDNAPPPKVGFFAWLFGGKGNDAQNDPVDLSHIREFHKNNPQYTIKVYKTFAGLRFVILNQAFAGNDTEAMRIFNTLPVDPLYQRLCKSQQCFRARLTPKPWRIDLPRPESNFPRVEDKTKATFATWLEQYNTAAKAVSIATPLETFGGADIHPDIALILDTHDRYCCRGHAQLA